MVSGDGCNVFQDFVIVIRSRVGTRKAVVTCLMKSMRSIFINTWHQKLIPQWFICALVYV